MASSATTLPRSGFLSPQFWLGFLAVVGTFVLGQFGIPLNLNFINNLPSSVRDSIVPGVVIVGAIIVYIVISSHLQTRKVRKGTAQPGHPAPKGGKMFWQTSEFWLGLLTVSLNYLHDTGRFAPDVHASTNTSTLVVALVYTFARSQLKQAYASAEAAGN